MDLTEWAWGNKCKHYCCMILVYRNTFMDQTEQWVIISTSVLKHHIYLTKWAWGYKCWYDCCMLLVYRNTFMDQTEEVWTNKC